MNKSILLVTICAMCFVLDCTKNPEGKHYDYTDILEGLKLNYTQYYDRMEGYTDLYFQFYSISSLAEQDSLSARYKTAVQEFYHSDKKVIDYLLAFENSSSYNEWLFIGKSPLSSNTKESDLILEPEAALILLDYYLRGRHEPINVRSKPKTLTYAAFHQFYKRNKNRPLKQLRRIYRREF